jgi:hypothetical protein
MAAIGSRVMAVFAGEAAVPNINRPSLKHKTNFKTKDGDRWLPFEDDAHINQMIEAFMVINSKIIWDKKILKNCNRAFCNLPNGRDFAAVWRDPEVFVSFNPNPDPSLGGITFKKDITISSWMLKNPNYARLIASVLVHELAHVNGAPGGMVSKAAEATLPPCGFDDLFNPALVGMNAWRPVRIEIG